MKIIEKIPYYKYILGILIILVMCLLHIQKFNIENEKYKTKYGNNLFAKREILVCVLIFTLIFPLFIYYFLVPYFSNNSSQIDYSLLTNVRDLILIILILISFISFVFAILRKYIKIKKKISKRKISVSEYVNNTEILRKEKLLKSFYEFIDYMIKDFGKRNILKNEVKRIISIETDDSLEILYRLNEFSYNNSINFLIYLDWKSDIDELDSQINEILLDNFYAYYNRLKLPKACNYDKDSLVSDDNVFDDYSSALRKKDLQLGFINTESDSYMAFIHMQKDRDNISNIVFDEFNLEYYETEN